MSIFPNNKKKQYTPSDTVSPNFFSLWFPREQRKRKLNINNNNFSIVYVDKTTTVSIRPKPTYLDSKVQMHHLVLFPWTIQWWDSRTEGKSHEQNSFRGESRVIISIIKLASLYNFSVKWIFFFLLFFGVDCLETFVQLMWKAVRKAWKGWA